MSARDRTPMTHRPVHRRRGARGLGAGALASLLALGMASATPWVSAGAAGPLAAADEPAPSGPGKVMLVLDSSGSMAEKASGGQTKIAAAKQALRSTIKAMPDEQVVGLRVYGSKVFQASDPGACTDSVLVAEPDTGNRDKMLAAVEKYRPYGETPIGYALAEAGKDLGNEGNRNIILVSDGVPTCKPDPCQVARELSKKGINLRIDVVGLDVDSTAREALQCIADAGNGTYYDATDADDLASSLNKVAERAARGYQTVGTPVDGTPEPTGAPEITAGDWVDDLEEGQETYHYTVRREIPGSVLMTGASWRTKGTNLGRAALSLPDGTSCGSEVSVGGAESLAVASASAGTEDPEDPCSTAEELVLSVEFGAIAGDTAPTAEIRVTELAPVQNADELPAPVAQPVPWSAPARSKPTPVSGGTSFADAEPLEPGSFSGEIVPGETLTFTVDAGWGQSVDAAVSVPKLKPELADALLRARLGISVFSPARTSAGADRTEPDTDTLASLNAPGASVATTTGPIAWTNLTESGREGASLGGLQTVVVHLEKGASDSVPVPFRLDLAVSGEVAGEPVFEVPTETDEPTGEASTSATDEPAADAAEENSSDEGTPRWLWGVGGVALLAVLAGAGVALSRRRGTPGS